ncbi:hypothetical protein CVT24_004164 [Panaeolus cyanescens]|uniref:O-methyltransferase domain-containing protein n=1 Tax=Panaeolus cyanescens TaxID=181874 RepID=A0A409YX90_9AGAR|nr:hypothetical protein CVT24_004164 [Panaeolus cyanescens]
MPPAHGQLAALAELITQATKVVEAAYARTEKPYVPSLEDTEAHPLDDTIYDEELRKAVQTIEGACAQLSATVGKPSHTVVNRGMAVFEISCLNVILTFKIPDILQTKPEGMHISEIGEKSGLEARKIGRVLRLLSTRHIFTEVSENVFANNRLSIQYLSSNPLSSLNLHFTDEVAKSSAVLSDVLADKEWGHSYSPCHTPFNKYSGYAEPLFVYFEGATPRGAELGARFGLGMMGWGKATEAEAVIDLFPWKDLPQGTSVVDVGGGIGNVTMQLAKKYPTLQLKLQDLPERIVQAKNEVWPEKCPEAIAEQRIEFKALDFFAETPIPNCDIYYLKNIMQAESIKILQGVRKAMGPNSRVLVQEYILQGTNRVSPEEAKSEQAPEPLLPNYGSGRIRQYYLDIDMMTMLNSEERHLSAFIKLGEAAGLRFEKPAKMTNVSHGNISALVELITQASKIVEAAYSKTEEKPWIPSLDDTEPHPLDRSIYTKELKTAIQVIEGACAQLCATVAKPSHTLTNRNFSYVESVCINIVLTYKIPDVLQEKPGGMDITEIGQKTGLEPTKLGRILRFLAIRHIFREVTENVFANNRISIRLKSDSPFYSLGLHATDESQKSANLLAEILGDKDTGHSFSPHKTAFNKYSGFPGTLFEYFEGGTPEGAERGARFGIGLMGWAEASDSDAVVEQFPLWKELPHGSSLCDIGGGVGVELMGLAKKYPTLKLILQELPDRINQAKNDIWPKQCPEAIAEGRIQFEPIDFFVQSPVSKCDVYLLKHVLHDWPDAECIKILTGVRKVMAPTSRLLVQENILQSANRVPQAEAKYEQAPEPLLPNYGTGRIRQYGLDIDMLVMFNSEERRLSRFIELGNAAGLRFEKLWDLGETGVVEFRLA